MKSKVLAFLIPTLLAQSLCEKEALEKFNEANKK